MRTFFKNKIVQISIFLLIAVALIYWQYSALSSKQVDEIRESFALTQWHYFFLALLVGFLSHFFRALRWQLMIHQVGFHTSKGVITSSVLMGYLTNLLIPRLGEVMRCTTLYKYEKVPIEKSVGTVVSERVFDLISLIALFFLVLVIEYDYVSIYAMELVEGFESKFQIQYHWSWWIIIGLIVGMGFLLLRFLYKKYLIKKIGHVLNSFIDGIRSIWTLERKFLFLFYSIIIWILYVLMVYIALKAVPATADLPIEVSMVLTAFGSIAIILTPGGIGAYPPIVAGLLSIYSIPYSLGLSAGWVSWLMQTIVVLILGIGTLIYLPFINKKKENYGEKSRRE